MRKGGEGWSAKGATRGPQSPRKPEKAGQRALGHEAEESSGLWGGSVGQGAQEAAARRLRAAAPVARRPGRGALVLASRGDGVERHQLTRRGDAGAVGAAHIDKEVGMRERDL